MFCSYMKLYEICCHTPKNPSLLQHQYSGFLLCKSTHVHATFISWAVLHVQNLSQHVASYMERATLVSVTHSLQGLWFCIIVSLLSRITNKHLSLLLWLDDFPRLGSLLITNCLPLATHQPCQRVMTLMHQQHVCFWMLNFSNRWPFAHG